MPVRILIVEDEPLSRLYLNNLLTETGISLEVVGTAAAEDEAVDMVSALRPDLLFLDIELQQGSGFGVITRTADTALQLICTTALDEHATNLLQLSGVPFIQKPIDLDCLTVAIQAALAPEGGTTHRVALSHLRETLANGGVPRSMLTVMDGTPAYIAIADVIALEAADKACRIRHVSGTDLLLPVELKEAELLLKGFGFFRPHMQYVINRRHVRGINPGDAGFVLMSGGIQVPISEKKLGALRGFLQG